MQQVPLDKATIVAMFLEALLYGVFWVTFLACLYILIYKRRTKRVNVPMLFTAVALWVCATMHIAIDLRRMLDAFYTFRDTVGPDGYLGQINRITHVLKSAVYITQTCISDALVVYRCHAVVKNYTLTLMLSAMVLGSARFVIHHPRWHDRVTEELCHPAIRYGSIYMLVHIPPFKGSIFNTALAPYITSFNIVTAATNIFATAIIAWNIWYVNHRVSGLLGDSKLWPVVLIVVESGAVYAFVLLLLTAFYTSDNNAQFIVLDAVSPIIGIVFCLIIIQVGLRREMSNHQPSTWLWTSPDTGLTHPSTRNTGSLQSGPRRQTIPTFVNGDGHIALTPIAVNVTTTVHDDRSMKSSGVDSEDVMEKGTVSVMSTGHAL
ncbi:hypothetical protein EIP86_007674 [Pleurotus ostreatoroseus]|nr:hypothetical protein EIP86_007674 [Pleurotus ostreatoroseus]